MPKQRITVEVRTPQWRWCDLQNPKDKHVKTGERCRFCKELKKRGQASRVFCLLFNVELSQKGDVVEKTCLCMQSWKKNQIVNLTDDLTVDTSSEATYDAKAVKTMVRDALNKQKKLASDLIKNGIPEETANKVASQQILSEWS